MTEHAKAAVAGTPSRRPFWKRFLAYFALLAVFAVPATALLSYQGFCFPKVRFVNDAQIIEAAVRGIASYGEMIIDSSDASVREFLRSNPNCCAVNRHPQGRTWADVLTGWNIAEVEVNYERSAARSTPQGERYYKRYVAVGSCGGFLRFRYGTSTPTLGKGQA